MPPPRMYCPAHPGLVPLGAHQLGHLELTTKQGRTESSRVAGIHWASDPVKHPICSSQHPTRQGRLPILQMRGRDLLM